MTASGLVAFGGVFLAVGIGFAFVAYVGKALESLADEQRQEAAARAEEAERELVAGKGRA